MKLSSRRRPISFLKARALSETQEPLVITQNGEAKAVLMDVNSFDQMQETMALLKILAIGSRQADEEMLQPAQAAIETLRETS